MGPAGLAEHAVQERVDHDVAGGDPEPAQQALHPLARITDQDPAADRLVRGGILPEHQHPGCAVEPATMKNGPHSVRNSAGG